MKKILIITLLAVGLAACQENTSEEPVKDDTSERLEVEENESTKQEVEKIDITLYDPIIDDYAAFTEMTLEEAEQSSLEKVKSGAYDYFYSQDQYEGISVAYADLNGNGVEELFVALRSDADHYALIDQFSILDGKVISLFTDEMSGDASYKRSGYLLLENGQPVYTTTVGAGERYGIIYELNEEMEYVKAYEASLTEGDFDVIEKELENSMDLAELDWQTIGETREASDYEQFVAGDFSAIEGIWENGYDNEGSTVKIEGNDFLYQDGSRVIIDFNENQSDAQSSNFNLIEEDGIGGAALFYYPEGKEIEFMNEVIPSDPKKKRFFVTQSDAPEEQAIYYKVSDLEE